MRQVLEVVCNSDTFRVSETDSATNRESITILQKNIDIAKKCVPPASAPMGVTWRGMEVKEPGSETPRTERRMAAAQAAPSPVPASSIVVPLPARAHGPNCGELVQHEPPTPAVSRRGDPDAYGGGGL